MRNKTHLLELVTTVHDQGINPETNEIFLNSHINGPEDSGIDYRCTANFVKNFNLLEHLSDRPIIIHMNSIGGSISHGIAIYDLIKQSKRHVYIIGYSEVASMASIILQAADTRIITQNTALMVHNATLTINDCPTHGLRSFEKLLGGQEQFMSQVYAEKCVNGPFFKERGYSISKVKSYIRGRITQQLDWYLDSEEAMSFGFVDGILGSKEFPSLIDIKKTIGV